MVNRDGDDADVVGFVRTMLMPIMQLLMGMVGDGDAPMTRFVDFAVFKCLN